MQNFINKFKLFSKRQIIAHRNRKIMSIVNKNNKFINYLRREFHIHPKQFRFSLFYDQSTRNVVGFIELSVNNDYQFRYVEEKFNKHFKPSLNRRSIKVDFYLNKLYNY